MKSIVKCAGTKRGFTLLEVVLSIAIMLVLTTMIMNGFSATMSYSYHTSVYARTAASNYADAIANIGTYASAGKTAYEKLGPGYGTFTADDVSKLEFIPDGESSSDLDLRIQTFREYGDNTAIPDVGFSSQKENYTGAGEGSTTEDGTYSNNRASFYYLPAYDTNGGDEKTRGKIKVYYVPSGTKFAHWGDKSFVAGYYWYDSLNGYPMFEIPIYK